MERDGDKTRALRGLTVSRGRDIMKVVYPSKRRCRACGTDRPSRLAYDDRCMVCEGKRAAWLAGGDDGR